MQRVLLAWMLGVSLAIGGFFESGGDNEAEAAVAKTAASNSAPRISGSPARSVLQDTQFEFKPTATDANGDKLAFTITNKPGWAAFDKATGRLSGTPGAGSVGVYSNIKIVVSDGRASASLPAFGITVTQSAQGAVTLSWAPPTRNDDGSVLTDLAGYRIYVGQSPDALTRVIVVNNPGLIRYMVEDLSPARWHFAMTSVNANGRESQLSPTVSKVIG